MAGRQAGRLAGWQAGRQNSGGIQIFLSLLQIKIILLCLPKAQHCSASLMHLQCFFRQTLLQACFIKCKFCKAYDFASITIIFSVKIMLNDHYSFCKKYFIDIYLVCL